MLFQKTIVIFLHIQMFKKNIKDVSLVLFLFNTHNPLVWSVDYFMQVIADIQYSLN